MTQLQGKKVLLLAPKFYGYEKEIVAKLKEHGAEITYLNDDPSELWTTIVSSMMRFGVSTKGMVRRFEKRLLRRLGQRKFGIVLVINGQRITSYMTNEIRNNYLEKGGKMILYYWDTMDNLKDDKTRWQDFDKIFTFDNVDYEKHKGVVFFLPLFYCDKYWIKEHKQTEYDVMIVGSFRLNRYDFVKEIEMNNPNVKVGHYLYHSKWGLIFHKTFRMKYNHVKYEDIRYKKLSFQEVVDLYSKSDAIVDIPLNGQRGLTIRTIETLAMHKKLITTNANVKQYDFYNPDDIYVLPSEGLTLPIKDWYSKPYSINDEIIKKYSIGEWLNKMLY